MSQTRTITTTGRFDREDSPCESPWCEYSGRNPVARVRLGLSGIFYFEESPE